ncbi:benzyl alcohol O-benzoyltransferase-like [Silene latifolia]|uniref:benzyl alcohol O-benzoyltransferase-like n=1 Tax=Silene latifolia TaxID=37657 RepID=UPI003D7855CB
MSNKTTLVFKVTRQTPELITPAAPTRYEFKELSDIDDQPGLWMRVPGIQFYRSAPSMLGADPARVIKEAVSKALVPFYPLAGRLRKKEGNKLVVECNAEGVMFTEADAEVSLDEFSEAQLHPPIPCIDELLYDELDGYDGILNSPLVLIQVTRLKCGGFILTHKINHVMADGSGLAQFLNAVGELARGAQFLSIYPIWKRDMIRARDPPQITCEHPEFDQIPDIPFSDDLVHKAFFFGANEIAALRRSLPAHQKSSSTFEILTAVIWRSRTIALRICPDEEVRLRLYMNTRHKYKNPPLPAGFYGNGIATPVTISNAGLLTRNPIGYAVDQVKLVKNKVNEEYVKSVADFLVVNDKPRTTRSHTFTVSDVSKLKLDSFDFGWGPPVQGGPARGFMGGPTPGYGSFYLASKNSKGESGILVPIYLPALAMDRFEKEINGYLNDTALGHPIYSPRSYEKNGVTLSYGVGVKA